MKQTILRFTSNKINEISHPTDHIGKFLFDEMSPIHDAIKSATPNSKLQIALKNYFVIRLVTIVEDYFKNELSRFIDDYKIDISKITGTDEVILPLSKISEMKNGNVTKGKIVVANFNFENPRVIDEVVSSIIETKFFSLVKKFCQEHKVHDLASTPPDTEILEKETDLVKNWNEFISIFDLRNKVAHSTKTNVTKSADELWRIYENVLTFLGITKFIIFREGIWLKKKKLMQRDVKSGKTTFRSMGKDFKYEDWFPKVFDIVKKKQTS